MRQSDGGVTVDEGYRVRSAGEVSTSTSEVRTRADRAAPGAWDEDLGAWGMQEWNLPGFGERGPGCGEWYPQAVCETCGEPQMGTRSCGRRSCPDCWGIWAHEAAVRATVRVQAFRYTQPDDWRRQVAHATISPPEGEVMNSRQYWDGKKRAAEMAKAKGWRGFAVIPHPYRPTDEAKRRYRAEDPDAGIWVWLREEFDELEEWVYWSPHYHIIGATGADMEPARDSDEWVYRFIRSGESFGGVGDRESHEDVYGVFRYLLSHTGFPEGSTKQATTWHGEVANNKFVEEATEEWQNEKPSEGILSALEREIEEVAGPTEEEGEGESGGGVDDLGECPEEGCGGVLIDVFDVSAYLRQAEPPPEVRERMVIARDWRLGRIEPPPGMKRPQSEEQAGEAFAVLVE